VETRVPDGNTREVTFSQDTYTRGKIERDEAYAGSFQNPFDAPVRSESFVWMDKLATLDSLRHQVYLAEHRTEENSVPHDANLTRCLLNRNEPPDDHGRVTKTCRGSEHAEQLFESHHGAGEHPHVLVQPVGDERCS
jgi:hypothetical protein